MTQPLRRFTPQPKPLLRKVSQIVTPAPIFVGPADPAFQCDSFQNDAFQLTPCPVTTTVTVVTATQKRVVRPVKPQLVRPALAAPTVAATTAKATQKKIAKAVAPKLVVPAKAAPTVASTNVKAAQKKAVKPVAPKMVVPAKAAPTVASINVVATQKKIAKAVTPKRVIPASAAPTVAATATKATQKKAVKSIGPKLVSPATAPIPPVETVPATITAGVPRKNVIKRVKPKLVSPALAPPPPPVPPPTVVIGQKRKPAPSGLPKLVSPAQAARTVQANILSGVPRRHIIKRVQPQLVQPASVFVPPPPTVPATVVQGVRRPAPIRFAGSRLVVVAAPSQVPVQVGGGAVPYEPPYPYWEDRTPHVQTPEFMATMLALHATGEITDEELAILLAS